jgi:hypothetical protein
MPHAVIVAITPFLPLIEKLLDVFINLLTQSSQDYNDGKITKDQFLEEANKSLKEMEAQSKANNDPSDDFSFPDNINTAEECFEVANTIQSQIDAGKYNGNPEMLAKAKEVVAAFTKAGHQEALDGNMVDIPTKGKSSAPSELQAPHGGVLRTDIS